MTLIEVVAGLALLGTLLVGILLAAQRHAEQVRRTEERRAAVAAAQQLLSGWYAGEGEPPESGGGEAASPAGKRFRWQLQPTSSASIAAGAAASDATPEELGLRVLRLELFAMRDPIVAKPATSTAAEKPLVTVDLARSIPEPPLPMPTAPHAPPTRNDAR